MISRSVGTFEDGDPCGDTEITVFNDDGTKRKTSWGKSEGWMDVEKSVEYISKTTIGERMGMVKIYREVENFDDAIRDCACCDRPKWRGRKTVKFISCRDIQWSVYR